MTDTTLSTFCPKNKLTYPISANIFDNRVQNVDKKIQALFPATFALFQQHSTALPRDNIVNIAKSYANIVNIIQVHTTTLSTNY
jgi:hypothetical protein